MTNRFSIERWAAWAPGLTDQMSWRRWLDQPWRLESGEQAALREMPAMLRRRVEPLGRAALQAAWWCQADGSRCPVIFASRYGDMDLSVQMMTQLSHSQSLSPAAFSLSVHNAASGMYSIARGDTGNYSAVAAGADTLPAAVLEACGLLADGAPSVLLVYYEQPLPALYQRFVDVAQMLRGWACQLVPPQATLSFGLQTLHRHVAKADSQLPEDLAVLGFLVGDQPSLRQGRWMWTRHV